ncbi:MAG: hypothetical protein WCK01_03715 [Candidatus Uhrbacteria bacterium]
MTTPKKITKTTPKVVAKTCAPCKDGHGAHWHVVGWLAAVALVLSASTMSLSASAATSPSATITPTVLYRSLGDIHTKINRIEGKIDRLGTQCGPAGGTQCSTPSTATTPTNNTANANRTDPTACRQKCESAYVTCAVNAGTDQTKLSVCTTANITCNAMCGN